MVRKRTRRQYNSESESDFVASDSDEDFQPVTKTTQPATKKYSLRKRKQTSLPKVDYNIPDDDEEEEEVNNSTSDEDFSVEPNITTETIDPVEEPANDGLIDFEDIIRADVVLNFRKLDYEDLIQRTKIKSNLPVDEINRRMQGTPCKEKEKIVEEPHIVEPDIGSLAKIDDNHEVLEEEIANKENIKDNSEKECNPPQEGVSNGDVHELNNVVVDKVSETVKVQPVLAAETKPSSPVNSETAETVEANPVLNEDEDDDVIVLGELKPEIIVLDD